MPFAEENNPRMLLYHDDKTLLSHCKREAYQGSGAGGQKRNRVYSGVRLVLKNSKLESSCCERRSPEENLKHALRTLRKKIACTCRQPLNPQPIFPGSCGRINSSNPAFSLFMAEVFDLLEKEKGRIAPVAKAFKLSSSALARILKQEKIFFEKATLIRSVHSLGPIK